MKDKSLSSWHFVHANIFTPKKVIRNGSLVVQNGKIDQIRSLGALKSAKGKTIDLQNHFLLPGLIDLHVNGIGECDLSLNPELSLTRFSKAMAKRGVTTYLPTLISSSITDLKKTLKKMAPLLNKKKGGAHPFGIHLEGPFIHSLRRGAHQKSALESLSLKKLQSLVQAGQGKVKIMTLAPELDAGWRALAYLKKKGIVASMGHSNATYAQAQKAIQRGYGYGAHLFNAMPPWHHRQPGLAGAILESPSVVAELIGDGAHVSYPVLEMVLRLKGSQNLVLVSDEWVGIPQTIWSGWKQIGNAYTSSKNGILVGSACSILEGIRQWSKKRNWDWTELIPLATMNPSKVLGLFRSLGSIESGKLADLIIVTRDLKLKCTLKKGEIVYCHPSWAKKFKD